LRDEVQETRVERRKMMRQELRDEGPEREKCSETRGYRQVLRDERKGNSW
jgi:hypothetical protein